jgi:hypothetical protein
VLEAIALCHAGRAALEAFDDEGLHVTSIGVFGRPVAPRTGD